MNHFKKLALAAALASLALPAVAAAHERPSSTTVAKHIRGADQALEMVSQLVAQNEDAAAAVQFAVNRRQTHAAARETRRVAKRGAKAQRVARSVKRVAVQQNENAELYADLVDEVDGELQTDMAHAVNTSLKSREQALSVLTGLVDRLPARAQAGIGRAIAALSSDGTDEVQDLGEALESGDVPVEVKSILTTALGHATAGIDRGLERLQALVPQLPAQAQPHVQGAIDRIGQIAPTVQGILDGIFGSGEAAGEDTGAGALPLPDGIRIPAGPFAS